MSDIWAILFAVALLGVNAFFVGVEFSLISSRRDRVENLVAAGNRRAPKVLYAMEHLTIMLAGAQFGITVASVLLGKVGEPAVAHLIEEPFHAIGLPENLLHPVSFAISLLIVTILHIILGEMVPKNIALAGPETVATFLVRPHLWFCTIAHPIMVFLNWIARITLHLFGVEQRDELDATVSPSELAEMISESRSEGLIGQSEATRLSKALNSSKRTLSEVLIPRSEVHTIPMKPGGITVGEVEDAVSETGFSRFPVTDTRGAYLGYVHVKDVLDNVLDPAAGPEQRLDPGDVRRLITVEGGSNFDQAMKELRRTSSHMAQVSQGGRIIGVITLEDVIEELVGTVRDWTHDD